MKAGRLAYGVESDSGRTIDMAELIRCYGEPPVTATPDTPQPGEKMSQLDTPSGHTPSDSGQAVLVDELRRQTAVMERMAERIERLEAALLALPSPEAISQEGAASPRGEDQGSGVSFADIGARLASRTRYTRSSGS